MLLPENKRWDFFEKIVVYALDGVDPVLQDYDTKLAFTLMKANIDSCNKRYTANVENGKKGGRPTKKDEIKKPNHNPTVTPKNPNDNVNVNDTLSSVSVEGVLSTPPPPRNEETNAEEQFKMNGKLYEYYTAENGERRVRPIE